MSKPNHLFCPIRRCWVASLPEEMVRQYWLHKMISELHYPLSGFAVEKELRLMPHLASSPQKLPSRRADIIFFSKGIHPNYPLYPLLLIECKSVPLTPKVIRQIIGYNIYIQAPFVALVNQYEVRMNNFRTTPNTFQNQSFIPSYQELLQSFHT